MFKVIGKDGKEYGPVNAEELLSWIKQRRLDAQSRIKPEGASDWKVVGDFPEFTAALTTAQATAAAPLAPLAPAPKMSGMAITSLILGILGLVTFGVTAIAGLVFGIVALIMIQRSRAQLKGTGLAIAGVCVSGAMLLVLPIMAAMLLPALSKAKGKAQSIQCMNNIKQLNLALIMYASDHGEVFPPADQWCDLLQPYTGGSTVMFHCPAQPVGRCSYALNASLGNRKSTEITSPAKSVLIFSCPEGWNQSGDAAMATPHHHAGKLLSVGFADGHAEITRADRVRALRWD